MKAFVMLALAGSLLLVFAPTANADPSTGDCAGYGAPDGLRVVGCVDGEGNRCVVIDYKDNRGFACLPYDGTLP